jgi:hypothetical protein
VLLLRGKVCSTALQKCCFHDPHCKKFPCCRIGMFRYLTYARFLSMSLSEGNEFRKRREGFENGCHSSEGATVLQFSINSKQLIVPLGRDFHSFIANRRPQSRIFVSIQFVAVFARLILRATPRHDCHGICAHRVVADNDSWLKGSSAREASARESDEERMCFF